MSKNASKLTLEEKLTNMIKSLERQVRDLKTNQLARIVLPKFNGTPPDVVNGEIWYDTGSNKAKKRENGVTSDFGT